MHQELSQFLFYSVHLAERYWNCSSCASVHCSDTQPSCFRCFSAKFFSSGLIPPLLSAWFRSSVCLLLWGWCLTFSCRCFSSQQSFLLTYAAWRWELLPFCIFGSVKFASHVCHHLTFVPWRHVQVWHNKQCKKKNLNRFLDRFMLSEPYFKWLRENGYGYHFWL